MAPAPRFAWLGGFALVGLCDVALDATAVLLFGRFVLGVRYDPNIVAILVTLPLFVAALWGLGFVFSAIGLWVKKANPLSNIVSPFMMLLGGAYYPVALLPGPLRWIARALPTGYGLQALADAALNGADLRALAPQLLPLAGFAIGSPRRHPGFRLDRARGARARRTRPVLIGAPSQFVGTRMARQDVPERRPP